MPAYIVGRVTVQDPEQLRHYQLRVPAIVEQYGGRFVARGGATSTLEGPEESRRIVIMEFPSKAEAEAFYHSPEYTAARQIREGSALVEFIAVEGLA